MRQIEKQMTRAVNLKQKFAASNTMVNVNDDDTVSVYLHGNLIATADKDYTVKPVLETFYHWPTRTTASRLRALGIDASIKNGHPCIDGKRIMPNPVDLPGYHLAD